MLTLQSLIRNRSGLIIAVFALATLLAGVLASGVAIDGSVEHLMMSNDPARALDALAKEEFGNDEVLMVAFDLGAPYTEADLRKLGEISEAASRLPGVDRVRDLSTTEDIRGVGDILDASPLIDFETLSAQFEAVQHRTREHRLYRDLLVSEEQDALGMLVYATNSEANSEAMNELSEALISLVEERAAPWKVYYAGYPITAFEVNRIVKRDLALLTPAAFLAIGAILLWFTRRLLPIGLLLMMITWVEIIAHAWLAVSGTPLNVVVSILPTVLLATTGAYVIYSIGLLGRVEDRENPGAALVPLLFRPVLLSGLSTGIGFQSLRLIEVEAVGDLGGALSVGMLAAMIGTLFLLPAVVQRFTLNLDATRILRLEKLSLIGVRLARRPLLVIACTAALGAIALPGLPRVFIHTDTLDYFMADNRIRVGADFFQEHLSSGFLMNFVLRGEEENRALDSDFLDFANRVAVELDTNPHVDRTVSMLDYFYLMDAALRPDEVPRSNPGSRNAAAQYLLLYEMSGDPEDYDRYINFDRSALSVLASVHGGSSVYIEIVRRLRDTFSRAPEGVSVEPLGTTYLYARAMDTLTRGMLTGLGVAALLIGAVMFLGLRSVRLAAVAAIPNLTPLLLCGGILGWLGVPLSMGTSLVGCIALGLAVDDTAHVLGHLNPEDSLEHVYRLVGPPVLLTTLSLGVGFCALMLSEFQTVAALGMATTATLVVALVGDILLLPSLLVLLGYQREKGLVRS